MAQYYYAQGGQQKGPVPLQTLQQMASGGQLQAKDLVWTDGMANWAPAETVADLRDHLGGLLDMAPVEAAPAPVRAAGVAMAPAPAQTRMGGRPGVLGYQTPDSYYPADLKPVSFPLFVGLFVGGIAVLVMSVVGGVIAGDGEPTGAALVGLLLGVVLLIAGWIYGLIILYRAWSLVPPQYARTTPGKAVGFLFIPFFNLYWIFVAYGGFGKDYNAHVAPRNPQAPAVSEQIGTLAALFLLLSNIPFLGGFLGIAAFVLIAIFMKQAAGAINYMCQQR